MERDDPATSPLSAECLARYRVTRLLGRGGFGEVWAATQLGLERPVAVKVLSIAALEDREQLDRFRNEARISAALTHPNIVRVLDHGAGDGRPWIAYELVDGASLRERIFAGPLSIPEAIHAARDVLTGLDHAHRAGILHRDVKPENVLRAATGEHKVTDFGIAKWARDGAVRTQTGVVLGTPAYLAPEQLVAGQASAASDLYSWATLFYELLVGRVPFTAKLPLMVLQQQIHDQPDSLRTHRAEVGPLLDRLILRCLAKKPAERPEATEVLAALAQLEAPREVTLSGPPAGAPASSRVPASAGVRPPAQAHAVTRRSSVTPGTEPPAARDPRIRRVLIAITILGLVVLVGVERARRIPEGPGAPDPERASRVRSRELASASARSPAALPAELVALAARMEALLAGERKRWPVLHHEDLAETHLRQLTAAYAEVQDLARQCELLEESVPIPAAKRLVTRVSAYRFVLWSEVARMRVAAEQGVLATEADWVIYNAEGAQLFQQFLSRAGAMLAVATIAPDEACLEVLEDAVIVSRCFSLGTFTPSSQPVYEQAVKEFLGQIRENALVARFLKEAFAQRLPKLGGTRSGLEESQAALEAQWPGAGAALGRVVAAARGAGPSPRPR